MLEKKRNRKALYMCTAVHASIQEGALKAHFSALLQCLGLTIFSSKNERALFFLVLQIKCRVKNTNNLQHYFDILRFIFSFKRVLYCNVKMYINA